MSDIMNSIVRGNVELGKTYKDKVTGFKGVATAVTVWLSGCPRVALQGPVTDGKVPDEVWFDTLLVEEVGRKKKIVIEPDLRAEPLRRTGGPRRDPTR